MFKIYQVCKGKDEGFAHALDLPVLHTFYDGVQSTINKQKRFGSEIIRCGGFLDSGAFSFGKKIQSEQEKRVILDNYINFLNSDYNNYEINAQMDTTTYNATGFEYVSDAANKTFENYQYMLENVKYPERLCIVYHIKEEPIEYLKRLISYSSNGKRAGTVGIAMAYRDTIENKIRVLQPVFEMILDSPFANNGIHCLGLTIPQLLVKYPFTSSDSTSVLMAAAYGQIFYWIPEKNHYIRLFVGRLAKSVKKKSHLQMPTKQYNEFLAYVEDYGFSIEELENDRDAKVKFNYAVMKRWCEQYKCEYKHIITKKLF